MLYKCKTVTAQPESRNVQQEVQLPLTNRPTLVHGVKSCPLMNDCDLLVGFSNF